MGAIKGEACILRTVDEVSNAYSETPAFQKKNVPPNAAPLAKFLPQSDFAETAGFMQRNARNILRKDSGLQCPHSTTL